MDTSRAYLRTAAVCGFVAPVLLLAADILQWKTALQFEWPLVMFAAFVFFVPAIFAIGWLALSGGVRFAWVGMAMAFVGAMCGAGMQAYFRTWAELEAIGQGPASTALQASERMVLTTLAPGILFPIGLLLLALALFFARSVGKPAAIALVVGAIAFPIGHALSTFWPSMIADALILAAFFLLSAKVWRAGGKAAALS